MSKLQRMYETKMQRAKRLPVGTWFVYPDMLPRQYKYYQPKVHRVLETHKTSVSDFEDIGLWDATGGVNTPQAAYDRAIALAQTLNAMNADMQTANKYIEEQRRKSALRATSALSEALSRVH